MPYDEALAEKVRRALAGTSGLSEKKMFGGIAFLVDGAMCVGVNREDLILRCEKDETDALLKKKGVREFDLSGGQPMKGWILVGSEATKTPAGFAAWITSAQEQVRRAPKAPAKKPAKGRAKKRE